MKTITTIALGGLLMFPFSSKADLLKAGDVAPDFSAQASDGSTVHLGK